MSTKLSHLNKNTQCAFYTLVFGCDHERHLHVYEVEGDPRIAAREIIKAEGEWFKEHHLIVVIEGRPKLGLRNPDHSNDPAAIYDLQ